VSLTGFVTHKQTYNWLGGQFDTIRVALLNVNNVSIGEESAAPIIIQPNPSKGSFQINGAPDAAFTLYNTAGMAVYTGKAAGNWVELPTLPSGHYIIALDGAYQNRKFPLILLP